MIRADALLALLWPTRALAHVQVSEAAGLLHPVSGLDQILAMVSVGLWGSNSDGRRYGSYR